ncbi:MAG TPA: tetratricopeptide repeat protein [Azospirillum sp.]|nr:tetratricopeptide repeat protein [Azospirillum sp.]
MTIGFDIWNDEGSFTYSDEPFLELVDAFYALLDQKDAGRVAPRSYLAALAELIGRQPDFIDAHAHLGFALLEQGKTRKALDACLRGIAIGEAVIPQGFAGTVKWGYLENRPFLRALHGAALCQLRLRRRDEAARLMERMLAYNPDDNQGMRYLLGSEYLRLGKRDKARPLFEAESASYPPYHYELALLHIETGNWAAAATSLRRGFCANSYIAELLGGNPDPAPLAIWHGSYFAEPELAKEYLADYGDLWRRRPDAVAFVRWLFNHPKVLAERAAVLECQEELLWAGGIAQRSPLVDRWQKLLKGIDDRVSEQIVRRREHPRSGSVFPWLYERHPVFA